MKELKNYQLEAIKQLMIFTKMYLNTSKKSTIVFQSPTGSGKTITMARYIYELTEETDEDWNKIINTNLYSVFAMSQEVIPNMIHNKKGLIINMSSAWGVVGGSLEVIYSVSKAGIDGLTKSLAKELGPSNIRVNSIAPGMIYTNMNSKFSKEELKEIEEEIPLGKIGTPEDVSKCVEWLIEDKYTTGQVISINGGWIIT